MRRGTPDRSTPMTSLRTNVADNRGQVLTMYPTVGHGVDAVGRCRLGTCRITSHQRANGRSHQSPSFAQQLSQDWHPVRRPLDDRHESAELEIGDGPIERQALRGTISAASRVRSQESIGQRVEVIQTATMGQPQEPKVRDEVGHIEERVVLAKLIEVQAREPIVANHQMLWRKVTVGRTGSRGREFLSALLKASQ